MKNLDARDFASFAGRLLLSGIFLAAGIGKFKQAKMTEQYMASKNIPAPGVLRPIAGSVEILSGLTMALGYKPRLGAAAGFLFLVPTTLLFHDFWNESGERKSEQMINLMKNAAIMGGLAELIAAGPGRISLGRGLERDDELNELRHAA